MLKFPPICEQIIISCKLYDILYLCKYRTLNTIDISGPKTSFKLVIHFSEPDVIIFPSDYSIICGFPAVCSGTKIVSRFDFLPIKFLLNVILSKFLTASFCKS